MHFQGNICYAEAPKRTVVRTLSYNKENAIAKSL